MAQNAGWGDTPFDSVLTAAQADAGWAYTRLYRDLSSQVFGYFKLQGCPPGDAEDLTSEVFLSAFSGIRNFRGGQAQFRSWVFTIAHRRLADQRRRWGRRPVVDGGWDDMATVAAGRIGVEDDALAHLGEERVRALCATLSADQRDVLLLRLVSALTVEEVAAVVDKTEGAVKALQRRGLSAIRRILERQGVPL